MDMEKKLEPFVQHGTEGESIEVSANDILIAMAEGRNIAIDRAVVGGDLDVREIEAKLVSGMDGRKIIRGSIEIQRSVVNGDVHFSRACLAQKIDFTGTKIKGRASFWGTLFNDTATFTATVFEKGARFNGALFRWYATFSEASFSDHTAFDETDFDKNASFNYAEFYVHVSFDAASFKGDSWFRGAKFKCRADFDSVSFAKSADLYEADLVTWPESYDSIGRAYQRSLLLGAGYFFENAAKAYLVRGDKYKAETHMDMARHDYSNASASFRNAKEHYEKDGKHAESIQMYIAEREAMRRHLRTQKGNGIKLFGFWIWKYTCNYGESPWYFIGWLVAIILVFAIIYMPIIPNWFSWWPSIAFRDYPFHEWSDGIIDGVIHNIVAAIYFSAVTFATLGFGDIAPTNTVGRLCAIAEVLSGYLMFGVLITLVSRKMTRS
jgi:hypothetical protein